MAIARFGSSARVLTLLTLGLAQVPPAAPPPAARVSRQIELEVTATGGLRERVLTDEGKPTDAIALPNGQRYSFETRLRIEGWRYVIGVKVYSRSPAGADETRRTLVEELELESRRAAVTTRTDPPLEIRVTKIGGQTFSLLKPGIY